MSYSLLTKARDKKNRVESLYRATEEILFLERDSRRSETRTNVFIHSFTHIINYSIKMDNKYKSTDSSFSVILKNNTAKHTY